MRIDTEETMTKFEDLARKIGSLVDEKNVAYGNSFEQAGDFLRLLYPDGIPPEKYGDMLCVVRIFDKLKRIATNKGAFSESPYQDIVGYGLLGVEKDNRNMAAALSEKGPLLQKKDEELSSPMVSDEPPAAADSEEKVPVNCSLCGKFVTSVRASEHPNLLKQSYVHDVCWAMKEKSEEKPR